MTKIGIHIEDGIKSLVAIEHIRQGETILTLPTETQSKPDKYSIEAYPGVHVNCTHSIVGAINHACYANAAVRDGRIVAWKCIEPGDEIAINYRMTETHLSNPFNCKDCGEWMEW